MYTDIVSQIVRLTPMYNADGMLLIDSTSIICKCCHGHVHKYLHENAIIGLCVTCNAGTSKTSSQRMLAEKIFGVPFNIHQGILDPVYYNVKLNLMIKCGELLPDGSEKFKVIDLYMKNNKESTKILKSVNYKPRREKSKLPSLGMNI